jgi:hypothetical protein
MKPNTLRHNQPVSVASLRWLLAFIGTPFGFPLESGISVHLHRNPQLGQQKFDNPTPSSSSQETRANI